ncbi:MAG: cyclic nucleotide-binding domain-containing protein, partial [Chloroflexi bacterium]|nr:cyclic nucleotide-binding domain-containing protein [Chloroflexota bacterium]
MTTDANAGGDTAMNVGDTGRSLNDALRTVPMFEQLSDSDMEMLSSAIAVQRLEKGEDLFAEGDVGDAAYVVETGELEVLKSSGDRKILLSVIRPGDIVGEMALMDKAPRMAGVRATQQTTLHVLSKDTFDALLEQSASAARAMFDIVMARLRSTEGLLRQSEKMAQLGTLTAGVAHELNNPAAAGKRGADQLSEMASKIAEAYQDLAGLGPTPEQLDQIKAFVHAACLNNSFTGDAMTRSDLEYELEGWLEAHEVEDAWAIAPGLVDGGVFKNTLDEIDSELGQVLSGRVAIVISRTISVDRLVTEIGQATARISNIVNGMKDYAFLDQAPVQAASVTAGIDSTVTVLSSKLAEIKVTRVYEQNLPDLWMYASELNQVWTNLLENAADALKGTGE